MRAATINGVAMNCVRDAHPCPRFDLSLLMESCNGLGERIYGRPEQCYVDDQGRQWMSEALIGSNVARYLLQNPARYLAMVQHRAADFAALTDKLRKAHTLLAADSAARLAEAIRLSSEAYVLALKHFHMAQPLVEHWCNELGAIVLRHLSRREANSYLTSIFESPAAAEAVKRGFAEDIEGTTRIDAVSGPPIVILAQTVFPRTVVLDAKLHDRILHSGEGLATFWSLRTLAPLAVQLAEQSRYADYSLRTHLKHFLGRARECSSRVNDPYELEWRHLVALLEGAANDAP